MKKTTIWISHDLTPRHNPKGWPEAPKFPLTGYTNGFWDEYFKALAKAKKESIPFESHAALYPTLNLSTPPDSFLEIDGEVAVIIQRKSTMILDSDPHINDAWIDCSGCEDRDPYHVYRQVARLKPAEAVDSVIGWTIGEAQQKAVEGRVTMFAKFSGPVNVTVRDEQPRGKDYKPLFSIGPNHLEIGGVDMNKESFTKDDVKALMDVARIQGEREVKQQLAEAQAKLKKLEAVTAQILTEGLKSAIVKGFEKRWMEGEGMDPASDLEHTLRELNIR